MNQPTAMSAARPFLGLADRSDRVRLEIGGPDRAKFLHNLTTNDIKRLPAGRGCEAFITSLQGKTLAYVIVLAADDRILVRTDAGGLELALPHLRKYGVFDEVTIDDVSASTFEFHLAGPSAADLLRGAIGSLPEEGAYSHMSAEMAGHPLRLIQESPLDLPGFTLIGDRATASLAVDFLRRNGRELGLTDLEPARFEAMRIAAGTPIFGKDISDKNLPQEIGRDDRAINFVKGCYLGQETVARIDAVGHVNQILKGLRFTTGSALPAAGWVLKDGDKRVGVITSAARVPGSHATLALALLRTTHSSPGTLLRFGPPDAESTGDATVSDLPMSPES